jgi:hypothetical protein
MKSETITMLAKTLSLIMEILGRNAIESQNCILQRSRTMEQFPGAAALNDATDQSLLASRTQEASVEIAEVAFASVVGTRQAWDVVAME